MRWLFLTTPPADGPSNMALDDALMRRAARTGDAVFRVYGWSAPTVSLGRNQRARGCYDLAASRAAGIGFVRRPTGGRALLHDREITYSATLPLATVHEARAAYHFINTVLIRALRDLGVPATMVTNPAPVSPGLRPCFDVPSEHEIAVGGRKLVGSAQWRHAGALLQHGSILVRDGQGMINELLLRPAPEALPDAATLEACLGRIPATSEVADRLKAALRNAVSGVADLDTDAATEGDCRARCATYRDDAWTWRR